MFGANTGLNIAALYSPAGPAKAVSTRKIRLS